MRGKVFTHALKRSAALLSAAVLTASFTALSAFAEDDETEIITEPAVVTVTFEIGEGVEFDEDADPADFKPVETAEGGIVTIPGGTLLKEGYTHTGWTCDGIYGYVGHNIYNIIGTENIVFTPTWTNDDDDEYHFINYTVIDNGEPVDTSKILFRTKGKAGDIVTPDYTKIERDRHFTKGWTDGEHEYYNPDKIVMPDHDLEYTAMWRNIVTLTYTTGDVDRINGMTEFTTDRNEGASTDLAANDRFSRNGFNLTGWQCSYDGTTYAPLGVFRVPGVDVTFTAVWTPKEYKVVFITGVKSAGNYVIPGLTDSAVICPEIGTENGSKYFAGWKDSSGSIYFPGDEYIVPGALPGLGISLTAVWSDEPVTQPVAEILPGDANLDSKVNIGDAVAILQYLANQSKYPLSEAALANADVDGEVGLTGGDAIAIQLYDAKLITLPVEK